VVTGDEDSLRQVMANLMANVRAHTPVHAPATVTLHNGLLEVADTGPGLPPAAADRMFDRFYRGDPGRGASGGSGLGLAIVAEVVRAHGGDVGVRHNPGGGLTVWFRLPALD
jgi:two-component system OmpR family sensor kinase